jgi:hypothetical protein
VGYDFRGLTHSFENRGVTGLTDDALAFLQSEPRRLLLHGENHQFDGGRQIQIAGLRSISPIAARSCGTSAWIRIEAHPLTVGGKTARQIWVRRKHYFTSAAGMTCSEPSSRRHRAVSPRTFVAVPVEGDHRDRLTDHKSKTGRESASSKAWRNALSCSSLPFSSTMTS